MKVPLEGSPILDVGPEPEPRLSPGARLGLHVDRRSTRHAATPVVAISLGESAHLSSK